MRLDPFTPWQEDPATLEARTVALDDALRWLLGATEAFLAGKPSTWCLVVGPRGAGKSHLLQLARAKLSVPTAVRWVGEDTAVVADAEVLWRKLWTSDDPWGWSPPAVPPERRILFVEGLDRLLGALRPEGRWTIRHHLQESGAFLVGTALAADLAASSGEALFGQLDTWALAPLDLDQARALFQRVSGESAHRWHPDALTRREALLRMAGGSPRAVVVLADAVRDTEDEPSGTAEGLLRAIRYLVTHYQQRFYDLPPLGQQMVEALAHAPRELTASEVKERLGTTSAAVSAAARTLEAAGFLRRHPDDDDARVTRYALAEPLFRHWLEYRTTASWEQTRAAWLGRLLGEVLMRHEIADVWWSAEGILRDAAKEAVRTEGAALEAYKRLLDAEGDAMALTIALERLLGLKEVPSYMAQLVVRALLRQERRDLLIHLEAWLPRDEVLQAVLALSAANGDRQREAFVTLLRVLGRHAPDAFTLDPLDANVRQILLGTDPNGDPWPPLADDEQELLAEVPLLRARYAVEGRRTADPPLLDWARLTALPVDATTDDLSALLVAAHQRRDADLFGRVASSMKGWPVPVCPRPDLPAPAVEKPFARLLYGRDNLYALTWAASLASMSDSLFTVVLGALAQRDPPVGHGSAEVSAMIALGLRAPERFEALRGALHMHPSIGTAARILQQVREGRGPLQPELEAIRRAIDPTSRVS